MVRLAADAPHKPLVLAAGGIADGRGVAAALALGCDGAVLGTRLWASKEAMNKDSLKQRLVVAKSCDDVQRTRVFDQIQNSYSTTPWPGMPKEEGTDLLLSKLFFVFLMPLYSLGF